MDLGLERINALLASLGNPQDSLRVIHVAGTNGKGSVCAYVASVLRHAGHTVGRFNSPHLLEPHDSIHVNDGPVTREEYDSTQAEVQKVNDREKLAATSFEQLVATALCIFQQHRLDWVVIEVGLGGTLDATNVFKHPRMTIITSIGWDHAAVLGGSIESIALAKAGIMKPGRPVVIAPQEEPVARAALTQHAESIGAPWIETKAAEWDNTRQQQMKLAYPTQQGWTVEAHYNVSLRGDYQRANSAAAVTALLWLKQLGEIELAEQALQAGMAQTRWPGRLNYIEQPGWPSILVDGAHNPPAARALREYVDQIKTASSPVVWIIGVTSGKDIREMLTILLRPKDIVLAVPFSQPSGMPWISSVAPPEIVKEAKHHVQKAESYNGLSAAVQAAEKIQLEGIQSEKPLIVLCGSLYLVADFYRLLRNS